MTREEMIEQVLSSPVEDRIRIADAVVESLLDDAAKTSPASPSQHVEAAGRTPLK